MCLPMILGWCMARPSSLTQAGIPCLGFFGAASDSPSVSDLESDTLEDLDGVGATGGTTGTAVEHSSTITTGNRTAGTSVTGDSITVILPTVTSATAASTMAADSTGLRVFAVPSLTEVPTSTLSQERTPAHSVALITAEVHEAFPPAGSRALAEAACMLAASMAEATGAVDGIR